MPDVTIKNLGSKTIHCDSKTERLLDILLREVDWMHACGMKGRCTTCRVDVISGAEALGEITEAEQRFINLGRLNRGSRLSCQAILQGDVVIKAPVLYQLPHQIYNE